MQTFLPVNSIALSPSYLDSIRLNKQITEAIQIHNTLTEKSKGWINHPAVKMWRGYENALLEYAYNCFEEWIKRGGKRSSPLIKPAVYELPPWLGDEKLHSSHRARLILKGEIDLLNIRIRYKFKKSIDKKNFLKSLEIKDLRTIDYSRVCSLHEQLDNLKFPKTQKENFYLKFKWKEKPSTEYWWPV